jgi:hypothetical protein
MRKKKRGLTVMPLFFFTDQQGRMSWSKIEVGMARVQQALGISTMPLILPSTGAQLSSR